MACWTGEGKGCIEYTEDLAESDKSKRSPWAENSAINSLSKAGNSTKDRLLTASCISSTKVATSASGCAERKGLSMKATVRENRKTDKGLP